MLGESRIRERIERILSLSKANQTEVVLIGENEQLTRFANSYIHQNIAKEDVEVRVRVVVGKKVGVASANDLSDAALQRVVESAMTVASFQQDNPDFTSLPEPTDPEIDGFARGPLPAPYRRARAAKSICLPSREQGLNASGAFATRTTNMRWAIPWALRLLSHHHGRPENGYYERHRFRVCRPLRWM